MMDAAADTANVLIEAAVRGPSPPSCSQRAEEECNNIEQLEKEPRGKLSRSLAVCEETPTFEETQHLVFLLFQGGPDANASSCCDDATSCKEEEQDPKEDSPSKGGNLGRTKRFSSEEYTDSTGIDLQQFIVDSLNSNPRDRLMLLKLEQDMRDFIGSDSPFKKFAPMSPYHRMLVHRVAAYFGMEHNVDHTGKSVIINTTSRTQGAATAQAPAGRAAAGRAAWRLTVTIATTPDLGAAQTPTPPTSGRIRGPNPTSLPATTGTHEVHFFIFFSPKNF
uniref:R3H domain-containing protein n=1 Tax=Oryzias latipes TaxID=8090 RepID=A0A3P9HSQ4_ORYLA